MKRYAVLLIAMVCSLTVYAEIVTDNTLGHTATSLAGPDFLIQDNLGRQVGANLFHSFTTFNLNAGESATFTGPATVHNIISRVIGGQASFINGAIHSRIPSANLYLLNPYGIAFGEQAQLDVSGALYLSTADVMYLGAKDQFNAIQPNASTLTTAPPRQFGFLDNQASQITFQRSQLALEQPFVMVGDAIRLQDSTLLASQFNLRAEQAIQLTQHSQISIVQKADQATGRIDLKAPTVILSHESYIDSNILGSDNGGTIMIQAPQRLDIIDNSGISVAAGPDSTGDAGQIRLQVGQLTLRKGGFLNSGTQGHGQGGAIVLKAQQGIELTQDSLIASSVGDLFTTGATGNGGDIQITAPWLQLDKHSAIQTGTFLATTGQAGNITLQTKQLSLGALSHLTTSTLGTGAGGDIRLNTTALILRDSAIHAGSSIGKGQAGAIYITSDQTLLTDTSLIATSAIQAGGGNIQLQIHDQLLMLDSGISAHAQGHRTTDKGGNLTLYSPTLLLMDNSELNASAFAGNGGNIHLRADHLVASVNNLIDASSTLGIEGKILIQSPDTDLNRLLAVLPMTYLDVAGLIKQRCAAHLGEKLSSFSVVTYDALPTSPYNNHFYAPLPHELTAEIPGMIDQKMVKDSAGRREGDCFD